MSRWDRVSVEFDAPSGRYQAFGAYDVKEELKRRSWRWDSRARCWWTTRASAIPPELAGQLEIDEEVEETDPWDEVVVTYQGGVWEACNSYEVRAALKRAGWRWNASKKCWWTNDPDSIPPEISSRLEGDALTAYEDPEEPDLWAGVNLSYSGGRWIARNSYEVRAELKAAGWRWEGGSKSWQTGKADKIPPELVQRLKGAPLTAYNAAVEEVAARAAKAEAAKVALLADFELDMSTYPEPDGFKLYPHQRLGVGFSFGKDKLIIADEAGVGKTPQALVTINATPSIQRVLIIVPANLRLGWLDEWARWVVPDARTWHVHVALTGGAWRPETNMLVISWALMRRKAIWERLMAQEWDLVVADEAHFAKNEKTANAKRFYGVFSRTRGSYGELKEQGIIHNAKRAWMMTGTPMPNGRPAEMWTLFRGASVFQPDQWWHYHKRYCGGKKVSHGRSGSHWDFTGATNLGELYQILQDSGVWLRRRLCDVTDLPPKQRQVVPLHIKGIAGALRAEEESLRSLGSKIKRLEEDLEEAARLGDDEAERVLGERIKNLSQALFGEITKARHKTTLLKLPAVVSYLKELLSSGNGNGDADGPRLMAPGDTTEQEPIKIVVVGWFRDVLEQLRDAFPEESVLYYGGSTPSEKEDALIRFQGGVSGHGDAHDPKCRLFLTNPRSGGVGLTLTRSHTCVFVELDWSPGVMTQAEGRIYRISQKSDKILFRHLVLRDSIDERLAYSLIEKQKAIAAAIGDDTEIIPELSIRDTADILSALVG